MMRLDVGMDELEISVADPQTAAVKLAIRGDFEGGASLHLDLDAQREVASTLLRNLIDSHGAGFVGCPLASIPEINPCPLCNELGDADGN
jgi:hypothetical protein